ncbi:MULTISPECIES: glucose-1-phosphate thymidylyltransferase [Streptomyces]|uniref:glucose-1-phosphate thymidylyltransferase n=1 Tax=Streptomyces TaxID=1883 RepID=UPI00163C6D99|nr:MULTISPECIES: glucose-1-phosphate thymidylyltransferase [Streptomyces]MBC2875771.1 glucose-1-phosphate thymidylyltransferase [Streptomyces sp. TYQ1024]UBI37623.1 glucose-1-phosphate thymidylyltransferase [Streptomyces mobaraensis]UKW30211.1 glucose-1-phosphate thymidylyltransferase [Streptomyces sp. TYQ1024]
MKALILVGGVGSRLRPITHTSAKQLIPVANIPVLSYVLNSIKEAGITEVGMVVGATATEIRAAVGDGARFGLNVTYLQQDAPRGLADAVLISRDFLGDDDFVMYLGDNYVVDGIVDFVEDFRRDKAAAQVMLARVDDPRRFGVAELDVDGRVTAVVEKPQDPRSDLAIVGVYAFSPLVHQAVAGIKPSWRDELEITDAVQWLVDQGHRVGSTVIDRYWKDIAGVDDVLEMNRHVLETVEGRVDGEVDEASELVGRVVVEAGAKITGSRIVGPAVIGPDTVVQDSYVGPFTSIDGNCRIAHSEIQYSIVLRGASIEGVARVEDSVIGRETEVNAAPRTSTAHRLVLGDHSRVRVGS